MTWTVAKLWFAKLESPAPENPLSLLHSFKSSIFNYNINTKMISSWVAALRRENSSLHPPISTGNSDKKVSRTAMLKNSRTKCFKMTVLEKILNSSRVKDNSSMHYSSTKRNTFVTVKLQSLWEHCTAKMPLRTGTCGVTECVIHQTVMLNNRCDGK